MRKAGRPGGRVAVSLIGLICPSCMSRCDFSTLTLQTVQNGPGGGMRGPAVAPLWLRWGPPVNGPEGLTPQPLISPLTQC